MVRLLLSLVVTLMFFTCFGITAMAEVEGFWRRPAQNVPIEPLELRSPDKETFTNPNGDWIAGAVLTIGQQGGNDLGLFDVSPYINGGQGVVPVTPIDTGTNQQFGIDGLVGTANGHNLLSLCHNGNPKVIRFDGDTLVDIKTVSNQQCNETSITSVPGQPNWAYTSFYDASITTIRTFYTVDGGDNWSHFYDITGNFGGDPLGGINGGVIHDITGINTGFFNEPVNRQGFCANYTESNGTDNLNYVMKCVQMDINNNPQAFFTQIFDTGNVFARPAESRSKTAQNGRIATMYFRNVDFGERIEARMSELSDIGTNLPNLEGYLLGVADNNNKVITGDYLPFGIDEENPNINIYIAGWDAIALVSKSDGTVRTPDIRNNPCGQSTQGIVTPISYAARLILTDRATVHLKRVRALFCLLSSFQQQGMFQH